MAVNLTAAQLSAALRLGDSSEETAEATRLLAFVTAAVTKHAPDAPDTIHNEAAIRLAGMPWTPPLPAGVPATPTSGATVAHGRYCCRTARTGRAPPDAEP